MKKVTILLLVLIFVAACHASSVFAQSCDLRPDPDNLINNSNLECDNNHDGVPDEWYMNRNDSEHNLSWINDTTGEGSKILKSEFTGKGENNYFGWYQTITNVKPNTSYEFSFSFATEDIAPILKDNQVNENSKYIGAGVRIYGENETGQISISQYSDSQLWAYGPELTDWDESAWVYRTYRPSSYQNWKTVTKYFKTPSKVKYFIVATYNYPKGKLYIDDFKLKEVSDNPESAPFKKSGTLNFIKYNGSDFFPIFLNGLPKQGGKGIDAGVVKEKGFNTVSIWDKNLIMNLGLAAIIALPNVHEGSPDNLTWVNDPGHSINYNGKQSIIDLVGNWTGFGNLLAFLAQNEIDCHPARDGVYIPNLEAYERISEYVRNSGAKIFYSFCGSYSSTAEAYTRSFQDLNDHYYPLADIVAHTANLPRAYPSNLENSVLDKIGIWARNGIHSSPSKYFLARGMSRFEWADWDGVRSKEGRYRYNIYVPFNLQRFQVFHSIINGAVGVWFPYASSISLDDIYYEYSWQQITTISKELSSLYPVLLEPQFYDEWEVSDDKIEVMMKKHGGKIYLLTASTHYEDLEDVTISLDNTYRMISVKALNDVINGNIGAPVNRTISLASPNSFVDDFIGDSAASPAGVATPGYDVNVYEIEYSVCGDGRKEGTEECDGTDLGGKTCASLPGYGGGWTPSCYNNCTINTDGCIRCRTGADKNPCNGKVELGELVAYIDEWYRCSACVTDLYQAIEAYFS